MALVQRGNMGGRTQLTDTGTSLLAYCDKALAVCAEASQVHLRSVPQLLACAASTHQPVLCVLGL